MGYLHGPSPVPDGYRLANSLSIINLPIPGGEALSMPFGIGKFARLLSETRCKFPVSNLTRWVKWLREKELYHFIYIYRYSNSPPLPPKLLITKDLRGGTKKLNFGVVVLTR